MRNWFSIARAVGSATIMSGLSLATMILVIGITGTKPMDYASQTPLIGVLFIFIYCILNCFFCVGLPLLIAINVAYLLKIRGMGYYLVCGVITGVFLYLAFTRGMPLSDHVVLPATMSKTVYLIAGAIGGFVAWRELRNSYALPRYSNSSDIFKV